MIDVTMEDPSRRDDRARPHDLYDEEYYRTGCGPLAYDRSPHWLSFFGEVADGLIHLFAPATVLDAGCALGLLVESLWDRGVRATGIDISTFAIANVRPDMRPHCRVGSLGDPIEGRFDVVTCIEVLEHMDASESVAAIGNMCAATDTIVFSSTPSDFAEPTHVNVNPPLVWIELFAHNGFGPDPRIDAAFLTSHTMVFRRGRPYDAETLGAYAQLVRHRILSSERLQAVAVERNTAHVAHQEVQRLQALLVANEQQITEAEQLHTERSALIAEVQRLHAELLDLQRRSSQDAESLISQLNAALDENVRLHGRINGLQQTIATLEQTLSATDASRLTGIDRLRETLVRLGEAQQAAKVGSNSPTARSSAQLSDAARRIARSFISRVVAISGRRRPAKPE